MFIFFAAKTYENLNNFYIEIKHKTEHFYTIISEKSQKFFRGLRPRIDISLVWFAYHGIMHQIMHFPSENLKNFSRGLRPRTPKIDISLVWFVYHGRFSLTPPKKGAEN